MAIRVFGLTGGVASGKSTVAQRFRERGLEVIDADRIARDVVEPGTDGLAEVVAAFGGDVLRSDGTLDRPKLGALVFADPEARRRLNAILHPRIGAETRRRIAELDARGVALAVYEAALLVENGLADAFRPLVVVAVEPGEQRRRLVARDGLDAAEADRRIGAQLPLADKIAVADHVIRNDGTLEDLRRRADEVLDAIAPGAFL
jgi:dephospho-CoA kinase